MLMKSLPPRFATPIALGFALILSACPADDGSDMDMGDDMTESADTVDTTTDTTSDTNGALSHAADIQPLWDANCITACHTAGGSASFLDLDDGFATMVGKSSTQVVGKNLVEAGSSTDSYLVAKLRGTHLEFGGTGGQMPAGGSPLAQDDIAMVVSWIDSGANP